jgi:hypothetical protein
VSTLWRGVCLSHDPPIEFELSDGTGYDIRYSSVAVGLIRAGAHEHPRCDVVAGGYSYPLVRVACPCGQRDPQEYDVTELRLVLAAARAGVGSELAEWFRRNNCWTLERLTKLFGETDNGKKEDGS